LVLYRDYLLEEELDPTELQGKDLSVAVGQNKQI
jgi:hypothetical protein